MQRNWIPYNSLVSPDVSLPDAAKVSPEPKGCFTTKVLFSEGSWKVGLSWLKKFSRVQVSGFPGFVFAKCEISEQRVPADSLDQVGVI
jgi:hypothetical protein